MCKIVPKPKKQIPKETIPAVNELDILENLFPSSLFFSSSLKERTKLSISSYFDKNFSLLSMDFESMFFSKFKFFEFMILITIIPAYNLIFI